VLISLAGDPITIISSQQENCEQDINTKISSVLNRNKRISFLDLQTRIHTPSYTETLLNNPILPTSRTQSSLVALFFQMTRSRP
jgi:hypothetical protein